MSMDPAIRSRMLDLALRAHAALEHFRDITDRWSALEERDRVNVKAEVKAAAEQTEKALASAKKLLAENKTSDESSRWAHKAQPQISVLEAAVFPLKAAILDAETRAAIRAFEGVRMPETAFELRPGVTVVDPALFNRTLLDETKDGGPRWRIGALLCDLRDVVNAVNRKVV